MELTLDILRNDAFTVTSLQRIVDNAPYVPTMLGSMQVFQPVPIETETVLIYEEDGGYQLIPVTRRGAPDVTQVRRGGRMYALQTTRLAKMDTVRASELLGMANMALPESIRMHNGLTLLATRAQQLKSDMEATKELHRLGALQGKLLDADGTTVIYDYFAQFGVSQSAFITVDFSTLGEDELQMYWQDHVVVPMQLSLKNRWVDGRTTITALVGDTFWGKLMRHPGIRDIWKRWQEGVTIALAANPLAKPNNWQNIWFGGINWVNYRGSTAGDIAVNTNEARFFPVGATDVFNAYWAPGETMAQVQEVGSPEYLMIQPDVRAQMISHMDVFLRSYPLYACIYPACLMRAQLA